MGSSEEVALQEAMEMCGRCVRSAKRNENVNWMEKKTYVAQLVNKKKIEEEKRDSCFMLISYAPPPPDFQ
uniref:Uncharacterized protein n=1 Tax=Caenorhabditis japonica TaxID=281687 RepID=A0A8R1IJX0_CAEJA